MGNRNYIGWVRVSSQEQEQGFSLDAQEDILNEHVRRVNGNIIRMFRVIETASKSIERRQYREMLDYARQHAAELSGILFYSVDRAARNLKDLAELEALLDTTGVPAIFVTQNIDSSSPEGEMTLSVLGATGRLQIRQNIVNIKRGMKKRVESGLFISFPPYGYVCPRGQDIAEIDPVTGPTVKHLFRLFAYEPITVEGLRKALFEQGMLYTARSPKFPKNTLHKILRNRSYVGEVPYKGIWYPGKHTAIVDRATFIHANEKLSGRIRRSHGHLYGSKLIRCKHCGNWITGEPVTNRYGKRYVYYRCTKNTNLAGHPPTRLSEKKLDQQFQELFQCMRIQEYEAQDWFAAAIRSMVRDDQKLQQVKRGNLQSQLTKLQQNKDQLLNLRLNDEISTETYAKKSVEIRDKEAYLHDQIDIAGKNQDDFADIAVNAFELSQNLAGKWVTADSAAKRAVLELVCLNLELDGVSLYATMRKPFDVLVKGLDLNNSTP